MEKDIVAPTLQGTKNVFQAAKNQGVKRIIFTSNCASAGLNTTPENPFDESNWNLDLKSPLLRSKMEAERWAWEFSRGNQLEMVSICPPTILGPGFYRHTPSTILYEKILLGQLPPLPEGGCHISDVRDVAEAHWQAFVNPKAQGRYLVAGQFFKISEFMQFLKKINPDFKIPGFQLPVWALQGVRFADWIRHKITDQPREITGELIQDFVGKFQYVSTAKAEHELNWNPRPAEETIRDTFQWIIDHFLKDSNQNFSNELYLTITR